MEKSLDLLIIGHMIRFCTNVEIVKVQPRPEKNESNFQFWELVVTCLRYGFNVNEFVHGHMKSTKGKFHFFICLRLTVPC